MWIAIHMGVVRCGSVAPRSPHGSTTVALPLHHARYTVVLRQITVAVWRQREENSPKQPVRALEPEPKAENIQHPTTNIEHPVPLFPQSLDVGCSMLVVGCFQVQGLRKRCVGYGLARKALMRVTSSWLEGGSRASPESAAVLEVVREASGVT